MFVGREEELVALKRMADLKKASLVACLGRRRIGKSRLIVEFSKQYKVFLNFQGLAPRAGISKQEQLEHACKQFSIQTGFPNTRLTSWEDFFQLLAKYCENKKTLVFFDEISWMALGDLDFPGKLKIAWDQSFGQNPELMLVLCGSVSSWIEENILNSTHFVGRISLRIDLKQLSLPECSQFWSKKKNHISTQEKVKTLCITGGVPRYLEEINYNISIDKNIKDLCFNAKGILYSEFEHIFNDVFGKKSATYKLIIKGLVDGPKNFTEICKCAKLKPNGVIRKYIQDLQISGFIAIQESWELKKNKKGKKNPRYRLLDNYTRFYLKYIEPNKSKIEKNLFKINSFEELAGHDIIMGYQFENLILNNLSLLINRLGISYASIQNIGPYYQTKTLLTDGVQIDLLIQTKSTLYICEIKNRAFVGLEVINQVKNKIFKLAYDKKQSVRAVLISANPVDRRISDEDFFDDIVLFEELLSVKK